MTLEEKAKGLIDDLNAKAKEAGVVVGPQIILRPDVDESMTGRERKLVEFVAKTYLAANYSVKEIEPLPAPETSNPKKNGAKR